MRRQREKSLNERARGLYSKIFQQKGKKERGHRGGKKPINLESYLQQDVLKVKSSHPAWEIEETNLPGRVFFTGERQSWRRFWSKQVTREISFRADFGKLLEGVFLEATRGALTLQSSPVPVD